MAQAGEVPGRQSAAGGAGVTRRRGARGPLRRLGSRWASSREAAGRERMAQAERGVPKRPATRACVSTYGRQHVRPRDRLPPESSAMHAPLMPAYALEHVAPTRAKREGTPLRALAARLRTPLLAPGGGWSALPPGEPDRLQQQAATRADVCQRSSATVAGRHGDRSLRHHALRGREHPRQRAGLTAVHHFLRAHAAGPTAAERFFGQQPRALFTVILASVRSPLHLSGRHNE